MTDRKKDALSVEDKRQIHQDYLDRAEVSHHIRHALLKLVENKPSEPLLFLAEYFDSVIGCDRNDKVSRVLQHLQLTHHSQPSFQTNMILAYDVASVAKNPNSKKAALNRPGLTGSMYEEILQAIGCNNKKELQHLLLRKINCRASEMVPFDVFRYGITLSYVYIDFIKLCENLFNVLTEKHSGKVADKTMCEAVCASFKDAIKICDEKSEVDHPGAVLEAALRLQPSRLAVDFCCVQDHKSDRLTMNEYEFIKLMAEIFLANMKTLK